jgi:hypothetical protein
MTEDYNQRLRDECEELDDKVQKLTEFIQGEEFPKLTLQKQGYLEAQLPHMQAYLNILVSRVAILDQEEAAESPEKAPEEDSDA